MPPRRRQAGQAKPANAATLASLPDSLLIDILKFVPQEGRLGRVALVSKRLKALCLAPELLRELEVAISGGDNVPRRAQSLLQFLTAHAQHVQQLRLAVEPPEEPPDAEHQVAALVMGCLSSCGTAGALEQLNVSPATPLISTAWLPALTRLEQLVLGNHCDELCVPSGFSRLNSLKFAYLCGASIRLGGLPCSLTELQLEHDTGEELPQPVSLLSNLRSLTLSQNGYTEASLAALSSLQQLTRLDLDHCCLPPCLSALTQLDRLSIAGLFEDEQKGMDAALHWLRNLRWLLLEGEALRFPPSVTQLHSLERCYLGSHNDVRPGISLPGGAWLATVRWLCLPWEAAQAAAACGTLGKHARKLEYFGVFGIPEPGSGSDSGSDDGDDEEQAFKQWDAFWNFLATHPPLRCFRMAYNVDTTASASLELVDDLIRLKHLRPGLHIRRTPLTGLSMYADELMCCKDIPANCGV